MATSVVFENNEIINFKVYNRINEKKIYFMFQKKSVEYNLQQKR